MCTTVDVTDFLPLIGEVFFPGGIAIPEDLISEGDLKVLRDGGIKLRFDWQVPGGLCVINSARDEMGHVQWEGNEEAPRQLADILRNIAAELEVFST